jgi:hypothetical protein
MNFATAAQLRAVASFILSDPRDGSDTQEECAMRVLTETTTASESLDPSAVLAEEHVRVLTGQAPVTSADDCVLDSTATVAAELGVCKGTLLRWRIDGRGPPYIMLSAKRVGYPRGPRREWMRQRTVKTRAEARSIHEQADASTETHTT